MKITCPQAEEITGIQWEYDQTTASFSLNKNKQVKLTLFNQDFVSRIDVISGYDSADDSIGKLFYSRTMLKAGAPATFLVLNTGRIWWIKKDELQDVTYTEIIKRIINNPAAIKEADSVQMLKAAIDLIL